MGSKQKRTAPHDAESPSPLKHQLIEQFWTLAPAFTRWAESHMHSNGLTPQRVRLMLLLWENGPTIMSNLRNALGVTATNITALVDVLETEKLVARKPHPSDRRATMIEITPKGENLLDENCGEFKDKVSEIFSGFKMNDQKQFLAYLQQMRDALVQQGVLEESDYCCETTRSKEPA